jgi:hypothetical protein
MHNCISVNFALRKSYYYHLHTEEVEADIRADAEEVLMW